jgi:hypothetical protein
MSTDPKPGIVYSLWHEYTATIGEYELIDFPRLLGVFTTRALAESAAAEAATLPGFDGVLGETEDVLGLVIDEETVDERNWLDGFVTIDPGEDE